MKPIALSLLFAPLLFPFTPTGPVPPEDLLDLEREQAVAWLENSDSAFRANRAALADYAEAHPDVARAHYLLGVAALRAAILTNGSPNSLRADETLEALARAQEHLERAAELDTAEADACATLAFVILQRFMLGRASAEEGAEMAQWLQRGAAADPDCVSVRLLNVWLEGSRGMLPPDQLDAWMDRFLVLGESIVDDLHAGERPPEFWDFFGVALVGRALVFSPRPRPREAARLTEATLEIYPDFHMARAFLLPFVTERDTLSPTVWTDLPWSEQGVEPDQDGMIPGLPDATVVSTAREGDHLWVRVTLREAPSEELFGVNLIVDADGAQETGQPWWGQSNSDFTFDRLVSVWVALDDEGTYRGAVGITDDHGAYPGEMTNLGADNVGFGIDLADQAYVLRVPVAALGDEDKLRYVVAVGSNAQWNDDLPDSGSFVLER